MDRPKAYSYIRMSTPEQLRGDSLRRQLAATQKYANEKGLEIVERFDDVGVSAYRGRNAEFGALNRFRELVDAQEIPRGSYLIVESMDRLSRDKVMKAFSYLTEIMRRGITVVTLDDRQEYSEATIDQNHYGIMIALGAMARAHEESKRKAGLLSDAWDEKKRKARRGEEVLTKRMPAWLALDEQSGRIVEVVGRPQIVREIFTKVRDGWGAYSLSRHLNQRGEKPWGGRKNAVWRESYIKKIILSRTVLGEYQPHRLVHDPIKGKQRTPDGPPIIGYYPAVVSEQLYSEAQLAMSRRRVKGRGRKGTLFANLFTGLLRCSCTAGYRYINKGAVENGKGGQYLRCSVAFARGNCRAKPIRYQLVESMLLEEIESIDIERVLGGESRNQRLADMRHDLSMRQIEATSIEQKIQRVLEAITSDGAVARGRLKQHLDELEREQHANRNAIEMLEREISEQFVLDPEQQKRVIAGLLQQIRAADGTPQNETARRALVGELQRMIEGIDVLPNVRVPWEIMDEDPDWKKTYRVRSKRELEQLLEALSIEFRIRYRSGDVHTVDALTRFKLKMPGSRKMREWRLLASVEGPGAAR